MQYLIHDLLKLPLADRLAVVERLICSIHNEQEQQSKNTKLFDPASRLFSGSSPAPSAI